jgi:charged multivesicular body protein 6
MKEKEASEIDSKLLSVMEMIDNIEWEHANLQVMNALKEGNQALNKLHSEMSYDDVVQLLDETNEAIEVENQINSLLAGQLSAEDDTELQEELAVLMGEKPASTATAAKKEEQKIDLPNVPTHKIENGKENDSRTVEETTQKEKKQAVLA